jgi:hypothetical protein
MSELDRLPASWVTKIDPVDNGRDEPCWVWTGGRDAGGYGLVKIAQRTRRLHRVTYEKFVGPIADGLQIDHLCRVTACCNPAHLEAVTPLVNTQRSSRGFESKTRCVNGHAYDEDDNLRIWTNPQGYKIRVCRSCNVERSRAFYRRKREAS